MNILAVDGIILVFLFGITFAFSMLPLKLFKTMNNAVDPVGRVRYSRIISLLSCFSAGVFMGTGMLHLFPEVNDSLEKALMIQQLNSPFPLAEFIVVCGFFLILITEQVVLDCKEQQAESSHAVLSDSPLTEENHPKVSRQGSIVGISDLPQTCNSHTQEDTNHSSLRSVLLLAALSVHSLLEGIAIGLQPDVQNVLQIFIAVVLHKTVIAFSLGLSLTQSKLKLASIIRSNIIFSITSPLGMSIAMTLEELGHAVNSSVVNSVLQGLACGTFVYVTFFEILPHEFNKGGDRLLKLLTLLVGFSAVCGILFLEPDDETSLCPYP